MPKKKPITRSTPGLNLPPPGIPLSEYTTITSGTYFFTIYRAIDWLRDGAGKWHMSLCLCTRCNLARRMARAAVRESNCDCGHCKVCWAKRQIMGGKI